VKFLIVALIVAVFALGGTWWLYRAWNDRLRNLNGEPYVLAPQWFLSVLLIVSATWLVLPALFFQGLSRSIHGTLGSVFHVFALILIWIVVVVVFAGFLSLFFLKASQIPDALLPSRIRSSNR